MKTRCTYHLLAALWGVAFSSELSAQTSAFTYQGQLRDNGQPATGGYNLVFSLHDASSGGNQVGASLTNTAVAVSNGLFTLTLDFGAGLFDGNERWLQIEVSPIGAGVYQPLSPRQRLTSAPYALFASNAEAADTAAAVTGSVDAGQLTGTISSNNLGAGSITTDKLAEGAVTTPVLADGAVTAPKVATESDWFPLTIANPAPALGDHFGFAVAGVGTDGVLVGAYDDYTDGINAGAAYLFSSDGQLLTTFAGPEPMKNDFFGYAVAAVGTDRVLIGAYGADTTAPNTGAAYLFSTDGTLLTTFLHPSLQVATFFGYSLTAVGTDQVLIGAYGDSVGGLNYGAAYLFSTNGTLLTGITNPAPTAGDSFGISVAAVGSDRVLIGADLDDAGVDGAGAAYLYSTNGTLLTVFSSPAPERLGHGRSITSVTQEHS